MKRINLVTLGRFGNQMFQYAFARAYSEQYGFPLYTDDWIGRRIFQLNENLHDYRLPRRSSLDVIFGEGDVEFHCYCQSQRAMIYSKADAQRWFVFRPEIKAILDSVVPASAEIAAHRRCGDYYGYGYPVVSAKSYEMCCEQYGLDSSKITFITEESPTLTDKLPDDLKFLADFYRLLTAKILLRGNSSFSWWAATLGNGQVYSPVIEGLKGGVEHDTLFVRGNYPRFNNNTITTDLHLKDETIH